MHKAAALAVVAAGAAIAASDVHASEVVPFDCGWRFKWEAGKGEVCEMAFDDSAWQVLDLPHDAQFEQTWTQKDAKVLRGYKPGARGFKPMGAMWYRKHFRASDLGVDLEGKRVFLELGGLLCVGDVYLNGKKVGSTDYGYLPVWVDLTDALDKDGENVLAVWCSTRKAEGSRWYTGAGLYRDAKIVVKPKISIARHGIFVRSRCSGDSRTSSTSSATVDVSVELDGFREKGRDHALDVIVAVKDAQGRIVASAKTRAPWSRLQHQEVAVPEMKIANAKIWDVDSPNLYTAEVSLVLEGKEIDRERVRFGVRSVEMDRAYGLRLNGRKLFIKSISGHHDLGLVGAAAYRRAIRRQFETMKAFGYNAIRCSHNPYSDDFYDLADEMGLLVLDELIDKWSDRCWLSRRPFSQLWPELVTEWIKRDRNHPCIFAWSFGNELQMREDLCGYPDLGDWGVTMYRVLKTFAARWDSTRPTTVAMFPTRAGAVKKTDPDFNDDPKPPELACATDFASFNYLWPDYENYRKHVPGLNIFQSEATVREGAAPYFGMDYDTMVGCSYWGAIEYWGESNGWPKKGWNYSFFSHTLEPFPTAWLVKSAMTPDVPVVRIAVECGAEVVERWNDVDVGAKSEASAWEGVPGEKKKVNVYTNCREVELLLNGRSLGAKKNDGAKAQTKNIVAFEVPFEPGELKAVGKCKVESVKCKMRDDVVSHAVRTAGKAVRLKVEVESDDYVADGHDLIYVRCRAIDKNGVQVRGYKGKVAFACDGAAKFLACDNGDHYTDELFTSDITAKNAKDGFILAAFRTGTVPGKAKLTIRPEGLPEVVKVVEVSAKHSHNNTKGTDK